MLPNSYQLLHPPKKLKVTQDLNLNIKTVEVWSANLKTRYRVSWYNTYANRFFSSCYIFLIYELLKSDRFYFVTHSLSNNIEYPRANYVTINLFLLQILALRDRISYCVYWVWIRNEISQLRFKICSCIILYSRQMGVLCHDLEES